LSAAGGLDLSYDFVSLGGIAGVVHHDCKAVAYQPYRYSASDAT
jgi:hypothetical protein